MASFRHLACGLLMLSLMFASGWANPDRAICELRRGDKLLGKLCLEEMKRDGHECLKIVGRLQLDDYEDGEFGFHIHQEGKLDNKCMAAGPHFNPLNANHGAPHDPIRHLGDLGNIQVQNKVANINITDSHLSLSGQHSVLNRAIVLHQKKDDLGKGGDQGSITTGNAGGRYACCVITKSDEKTPHEH